MRAEDLIDYLISTLESNARCHDNLGFNMSLTMVQTNFYCAFYLSVYLCLSNTAR
jgi:hypothetical protein